MRSTSVQSEPARGRTVTDRLLPTRVVAVVPAVGFVLTRLRRVGVAFALAGQLTPELVKVGVPGAVLQIASDLGLLGLCSAAPHSVDPLAQVNRVRSVAPTDQSSVFVAQGYPDSST